MQNHSLTLPLLSIFQSGVASDPQTSQAVASLDGEGNLVAGPLYADRLKRGAVSIRRLQPNTFTLRFLRTQVAAKPRQGSFRTESVMDLTV